VLVLFLIGAGLVALLLLNTAVNQNAFRLHALEAQKKALDLRQQQLERDLLELNGPGRLLAAANRLGLVSEGTPGYIQMPDGRIVGVPTPAKAVPGQEQPSAGSSTPDTTPPAEGGSVKPGSPAKPGTSAQSQSAAKAGDTAKPGATAKRGGAPAGRSAGQPPGTGGGQ
jgi:hypothetical protein